MNQPTRQPILQPIAGIPAMERGKLSAYSYKDRSPRAIPHRKLQSGEDEILVRTAGFKTAHEWVGWLLQQAVEQIAAART